jgi:hypothetical protein
LAGALLLGCSGQRPDTVTPEGSAVQGRLSAVHWLYNKFTEMRHQPPANAGELRTFGETLSPLEGGPVVLTEEFLLSPRDQKPIVIRYGLRRPRSPREGGPAAVEDGPVIAYRGSRNQKKNENGVFWRDDGFG